MTGRLSPRAGRRGAAPGTGRLAPGRGRRFGIAVSRFNDRITRRLLEAAVEALHEAGVAPNALTVIEVPGAFELPLAAQTLCRTGRYDAVICLGAVIRGDTPHFDLIAGATAQGIMNVGLAEGCPVIFGVLATDTMAQALARVDPHGMNRGREAAETALEMAGVMRQLQGRKGRRSDAVTE
ncbi:MAG: 6,7-dimethyl-8-ribityllumazine synthase [Nitrospiria bacterium]